MAIYFQLNPEESSLLKHELKWKKNQQNMFEDVAIIFKP